MRVAGGTGTSLKCVVGRLACPNCPRTLSAVGRATPPGQNGRLNRYLAVSCNWHGACCVMAVRIDDNQLRQETRHEHPLFQTHHLRSRSSGEQRHHGRPWISFRFAGSAPLVGDLICQGSRRASMAGLIQCYHRQTGRRFAGETEQLRGPVLSTLDRPAGPHRQPTSPTAYRSRR